MTPEQTLEAQRLDMDTLQYMFENRLGSVEAYIAWKNYMKACAAKRMESIRS